MVDLEITTSSEEVLERRQKWYFITSHLQEKYKESVKKSLVPSFPLLLAPKHGCGRANTTHGIGRSDLSLSSSTLLFHVDVKKEFHRENCCLHHQALFEGTVQS